jgi:PAS domain-containing protein
MDDFVGAVLNAMPLPVFVVDDDVKIMAFNQAASHLLGKEPKMIFRRRAGEILSCVHSRDVAEGCGRAPFCKDCMVRDAVTTSFREHKLVRQKASMELIEEGNVNKEIFLLVSTAPIEYRRNEFVLLILQDVSELLELKRILPICSQCKRIRNDDQYWLSVEAYYKKHMDVDFSHGLCPECLKRLYPDFCVKAK